MATTKNPLDAGLTTATGYGIVNGFRNTIGLLETE